MLLPALEDSGKGKRFYIPKSIGKTNFVRRRCFWREECRRQGEKVRNHGGVLK